MGDDTADQPLVAVFHADLPELLPLAEAALEQAGIEYLIRRENTPVPVGFGHQAEFGGAEGAADVLVYAVDAERARTVLADLALEPEAPIGSRPPASTTAAGAASAAAAGPPAYRLVDPESGTVIGDITESQFHVLADELEEESDADRDYYIDTATVDVLAGAGADAHLVGMLRRALGNREGIDIGWKKL